MLPPSDDNYTVRWKYLFYRGNIAFHAEQQTKS